MSLRQLVGNRAGRDRLRKMASGGRVPPSLLFTGPAGVGKRLAALGLAKALNCTGYTEPGDACDACPNCLRIERGEFSDVRVVGPEGSGGQIKAEAVRQVVSESPFHPFEGKKRIYIFDEADRMNPTAANSLLKTLEEPPPWTLLVLITSQEGGILPTLLSRCQKVRFLALTPEEVTEILITRHGLDREAARLAAAVSGGSVSRALSLQGEELESLRRDAVGLVKVLGGQGASRAHSMRWADELSKNPRLTDLLRLFLGLLRDGIARRCEAEVLHGALEADLEALVTEASLPRWLDAYTVAERALHEIAVRYANKRIAIENLLLHLGEAAKKLPKDRAGSRSSVLGGSASRSVS